jgi:hypothetical protein
MSPATSFIELYKRWKLKRREFHRLLVLFPLGGTGRTINKSACECKGKGLYPKVKTLKGCSDDQTIQELTRHITFDRQPILQAPGKRHFIRIFKLAAKGNATSNGRNADVLLCIRCR